MADDAAQETLGVLHGAVGVVVPVHNDGVLLGATLRHLLALGARTRTELRVVVADDGSDDGSPDIAAGIAAGIADEFGSGSGSGVAGSLTVLRLPHRGVSAARNAGLAELARQGVDIVTMLDADDRFTPELLTVLLPLIGEPGAPMIVQGLLRDWRPLPGSGPAAAEPDEATLGRPYRSINLGAALYRREVFDLVGPFDESYERHEDYDWYLRAYDLRVVKRPVDAVVLHYLRRADGLSARGRAGDATLARIHGAAIRRRRAGLAALPPGIGSPADYFGAPPDAATAGA